MKPQVVVLGPAGMNGYIELGALIFMYDRHLLTNVKRYVGASIGSLLSLLLILGYSPKEILARAKDINLFEAFVGGSIFKSKDYYGLVSNTLPRTFMERALSDKHFDTSITLSQLKLLTHMDITVVAVDLTLRSVVYYNSEYYPHMSVVDAILMSINIPIVFYRLEYQGHLFIDGGIGDPYPVDCVDDSETDIYGLYISSGVRPITDITSYLFGVIQVPMDILYNIKVKNSSSKVKHLYYVTPNMDVTGITNKDDDIAMLIRYGFSSTEEQLGLSE
jgi:predicted acylesterase/phospholipase RssA